MSDAPRDKRWVFMIGGSSAAAGAILGLVGNLFHPATSGPGHPAETARRRRERHLDPPAHHPSRVIHPYARRSRCDPRLHHRWLPGALARFGLSAAVVGTAGGVVLLSLDGFAAKHLAESWLSVPPELRPTALASFRAEDSINFALLSPLNLVFAGFTFVLYGLAAAFSHVYPRWLGWAAVVGGVGGALSGVVQAYIGEPSSITTVLGIAAPTIITLWLLMMGILLVRKAGTYRSTEARVKEASN